MSSSSGDLFGKSKSKVKSKSKSRKSSKTKSKSERSHKKRSKPSKEGDVPRLTVGGEPEVSNMPDRSEILSEGPALETVAALAAPPAKKKSKGSLLRAVSLFGQSGSSGKRKTSMGPEKALNKLEVEKTRLVLEVHECKKKLAETKEEGKSIEHRLKKLRKNVAKAERWKESFMESQTKLEKELAKAKSQFEEDKSEAKFLEHEAETLQDEAKRAEEESEGVKQISRRHISRIDADLRRIRQESSVVEDLARRYTTASTDSVYITQQRDQLVRQHESLVKAYKNALLTLSKLKTRNAALRKVVSHNNVRHRKISKHGDSDSTDSDDDGAFNEQLEFQLALEDRLKLPADHIRTYTPVATPGHPEDITSQMHAIRAFNDYYKKKYDIDPWQYAPTLAADVMEAGGSADGSLSMRITPGMERHNVTFGKGSYKELKESSLALFKKSKNK